MIVFSFYQLLPLLVVMNHHLSQVSIKNNCLQYERERKRSFVPPTEGKDNTHDIIAK